jgi:hypothetical protein
VRGGGLAVGVGGKIVEFGSAIVRALRHGVSLVTKLLDAVHECAHANIRRIPPTAAHTLARRRLTVV